MAELKNSVLKDTALKASIFVCMLVMATLASPAGMFAQSAESEEDSGEPNWELMVGAGVMRSPIFPGADEMEWTWFPAINASYEMRFVRWFIDFNEIGAELSFGPAVPISFTLGAGLGDFERDDEDAPILRGSPSIKNSVRFFAQADVSLPWSLISGFRSTYFPITVSYDEAGRDDEDTSGMTFEIFLDREWMLFPLIVSVDAGCTWMGSEYAETVYGVEGASADFSEFEAEAGLHDLHASVFFLMFFTEHIGFGSTIECWYLLGDAAKSPLVERAFQSAIGAFALYRL